MAASYDKPSAIVVLPPIGRGRLRDPTLKRWLARSTLTDLKALPAPLSWVLGRLDRACPEEGFGALRYWGQAGERPTMWMAAADPVYLEPRLDHLCVHAMAPDAIARADLAALVDHLEQALGGGSPSEFVHVDGHIYLRSSQPFATAEASVSAVDGRKPNSFLPTGDGADAFRRFVSEIEMALHDHPVNLDRQSRGLSPINSLWIWGGGVAPDTEDRPLPVLFADDGLLRGHWASQSAAAFAWPGTLTECLENSDGSFVALVPENGDNDPDTLLSELRSALSAGRLSDVFLLSRDGLSAHVRRSHALRVWRSRHGSLEAVHHDA